MRWGTIITAAGVLFLGAAGGLTLALFRPQAPPPLRPQGIVSKEAPSPPEIPKPKPAKVSPPDNETPAFLKAEEEDLQVMKKAELKAPAIQGDKGAVPQTAGTRIEWFTVHVESFRSRKTAEQRASYFKDRGLEAFTRRIEIPGQGTFYRVCVGRLNSQRKAQRLLERLKRQFNMKEARLLPAPPQ